MNAKEFIAERNRMCDYYGGAANCKRVDGETTESCPLRDYVCVHLPGVTVAVIDEVEIWSKTHPLKTRQSVFLEQHPNAKVKVDGTFTVCPHEIDTSVECYADVNCGDCCREYWGEAVE